MEKRKHPGSWLGKSFSEKGFYIVLLLSAAVIATSIWLMFAGRKANVEETFEETKAAVPVLPAKPKEEIVIEPVEPEVRQELSGAQPAEQEPAEEVSELEETGGLSLYFIWPVGGVLERNHSMETLLYDQTMADWRTHDGWDIAAALGTQVLAAANGTVTAIRQDDLYGTVVEIDHGGGLVSCYANLAEVPTVSVGDSVRVGDVIGAVGNTALSEVGEAYHLHFAMKLDGKSADPGNWLPER